MDTPSPISLPRWPPHSYEIIPAHTFSAACRNEIALLLGTQSLTYAPAMLVLTFLVVLRVCESSSIHSQLGI